MNTPDWFKIYHWNEFWWFKYGYVLFGRTYFRAPILEKEIGGEENKNMTTAPLATRAISTTLRLCQMPKTRFRISDS